MIAAHLAEHMSDEDLTAREIDVLRRIATGNRNRDIAEILFISEETVKVHIKHIMEKLGARDRTQGDRDRRPPWESSSCRAGSMLCIHFETHPKVVGKDHEE